MRHFRIADGHAQRRITRDAIDPLIRAEDLSSAPNRLIEAARRDFGAVLNARSVTAGDSQSLAITPGTLAISCLVRQHRIFHQHGILRRRFCERPYMWYN